MDKCLNCGKCCYLVNLVTKTQTDMPCPYLTYTSCGKTKCKVYNRNRLGRQLGMDNRCNLRENVKYNYEGCPYNVEGQPFLEKVKIDRF
jgi:hypothetical protein